MKRGEYSTTTAALNTAKQVREAVAAQIQEFMDNQTSKVKPVWLVHFEQNPVDVTAELALRVCLDAVGAKWTRNNTVIHLGKALNAAILNEVLKTTKPGRDLIKLIGQRNKDEGGSAYTMRERAVYIASKRKQRQVTDEDGKVVLDDNGMYQLEDDPTSYAWEDWDTSTCVKVGGMMLSCVLAGAPGIFRDLNEKDDWKDEHATTWLVLTEEAEERLLAEEEWIDTLSTMHSPMFNKPADWGIHSAGPYDNLTLSNLTPVVKHMGPDQEKAIHKGMMDGSLNEALKALNLIQSVPYAVNAHVVEAVEWTAKEIIKSEGRLKVESFPPLTKVPVIEATKEELDAMEPDEKSHYYDDLTDCKKHNRSVGPNRLGLKRRLNEAKNILAQAELTDRFYLPHQWDSRGRVYHTPEFGHHNTDYLRAMFMFANKGTMNEGNIHQLYIHMANVYGHGVDKLPLEGRQEWAKNNMDTILAIGADYKDEAIVDFWRTADEPFQFMAACREMYNYRQHGEGYKSGLPIAKDATQSGIQIYAVLGRNREDGEKVNLTRTDVPGDLYTDVMLKAVELVRADEAALSTAPEGTLSEEDEVKLRCARQWLAENEDGEHFITRGVCKSPTMTWSYSSKLYGFAKQIRDKIMNDLTDDLRNGRIAEHPFGADKGYKASWYMAKILLTAIEDTVKSAAAGMKYIQDMAELCFENGLHLHFKTPLNFPMMQYYRDKKKNPLRIENAPVGHRRSEDEEGQSELA